MEDSFKVRVDKVFGALSAPSPSLWSLTDEEIEKREWNRDKGIPDKDEEDDSGPFASRPRGGKKGHRLSLEEDLDDADDDGEDGFGDEAGPSNILYAKPDDHDEEEWMIRASIGMDCTLDNEEEEDEFDKVAVGTDRIYLNAIDDGGYAPFADTFNELPISVEDVERDPRANHMAAKLRVIEDAKTGGEFNSFGASQIVVASTKTPGIKGVVKSILKRDEKIADQKSLKRVRFDTETESSCKSLEVSSRSVKFAAASANEFQVSLPPPKSDPQVPDYLCNPSGYTRYAFDPSDELADEEANRKAYAEFFNLMKKKQADESLAGEDMHDVTMPVSFKPRRKTTDDSSEGGGHKENAFEIKGVSAVIAAADEVCTMEEDEPEIFSEPQISSRKPQRQYRRKATVELLEE